jgi:hypothetical protein
MGVGVAQGGLVSPVLFSLYVNDIPTPSLHIELAQYADYTALVATSRNPSLFVGYLEAYLGRLELWIRNWRIAIKVSKSTAVLPAKAARRVRPPRPMQFLGEPILGRKSKLYWGDPLYAANLVGTRNQVRKKAARRLGVLGPLLNRKSGLSVRNGVLLYKQLIRPVTDYASPIWRSAARSHVQKLQVLQYNQCLRIAINAPWYVGNRQIQEDLEISLFADIKALTESFDSNPTPATWKALVPTVTEAN